MTQDTFARQPHPQRCENILWQNFNALVNSLDIPSEERASLFYWENEYRATHTSAPAPARYLPISLDFQPICIDKPCIGQIDICPVDDECDSVKQCVEHAQWLKENPDVAEHNRKIITQHDAAIRKDEREKILKEVTELFCIQKDSEAWRWLETLRQQEQPK